MMHIIETPAYRQAFIQYLCKGTAIEISLKAAANEQATTHYIWRTSGDNKVRATHAANNGKIFAWDNPPETGHPGEDYNCRCTAEPYVQGSTEFAYQTLVSSINDVSPKWTNVDLTRHFYIGGGQGVTLSEIGHLQGVINHYFFSLGKYSDVNAQILDAARKHLGSEFAYPFDNSYGFRDYLYVFGDGVVAGIFVGSSRYQNGMLVVNGTVQYFYDDTFTDPLSIRELYDDDPKPEDMWWIERGTEFGGSYFPIKDYWKTEFHAEVKLDPAQSIYWWPR
jgi:SPP1 gp7 family putative phage head morphogenesis protein